MRGAVKIKYDDVELFPNLKNVHSISIHSNEEMEIDEINPETIYFKTHDHAIDHVFIFLNDEEPYTSLNSILIHSLPFYENIDFQAFDFTTQQQKAYKQVYWMIESLNSQWHNISLEEEESTIGGYCKSSINIHDAYGVDNFQKYEWHQLMRICGEGTHDFDFFDRIGECSATILIKKDPSNTIKPSSILFSECS